MMCAPNIMRDERGSVFLIVALSMMAIVGSVGVAVDVSRSQMVQSKLQSAVDSAGLVVGAKLNSVDVNATAAKYVAVNFTQGTLGTTLGPVVTTVSADNNVVTLTANANVPTTFMNVFGKTTVPISATTEVTRAEKGMELVLVLDNTGSMNSPVNSGNSSVTKIAAVKSAITSTGGLLDILYGTGHNTVPNLWVGVVPFSQAVNIGTGYPTWTTSNSYDWGVPNHPWAGCVTSRATPYDASDDPPSVSKFAAYYYPTTPGTITTPTSGTGVSGNCTNNSIGSDPNFNDWKCTVKSSGKNVLTYDYSNSTGLGTAKGPNATCPQQPVQPMVAEKTTVATAVNNMTAAGSTFINTGMAWGWRMLSPRWRTLWGGEMDTNSLPLDYNAQLMNKVVVLMTDGMNSFSNYNYTNYGYLSDNTLGTKHSMNDGYAYSGSAEQQLDNRTLAICSNLKANGVIIYTIGFGQDDTDNFSSSTSVNGALLKACATSPSYYFLAPTNADLQAAFHQIGDSLSNLRISH